MREYYSSNEHNRFTEHKLFKAELYNKTKETNETGKELCSDGHEFKPDVKKNNRKESSSNPIKRLIEKMTTSASAVATSVVSTVVVAAASVAVCLNVFAPTPKFEVTELEAGNDYLEYNVTVDELDKNMSYSIVVENNFHTFEYPLESEGEHSGLVTGLKPGLAYDFSLKGQTENEKATYSKSRFYTTNSDTPTAIFNISLNEGTSKQTADMNYSVYVSDTYGKATGCYFEMVSGGEAYFRDTVISQGFFKGKASDVPRGETVMLIKGTVEGKTTVIGEYTLNNQITPESLPEPPEEKPPEEKPPEEKPPEEKPPEEKPPVEEPPKEKPYLELAELNPVGINSYVLEYVLNKKAPDTDVTVHLYFNGSEEASEERELYLEDVGIWSKEYLSLPQGTTSLRAEARVTETDENGDPVVVFTKEFTCEFETKLTVSPWLDVESRTVNMDVRGNLSMGAMIVVTDKNSGETMEFSVYDDYYGEFISRVSWEAGTGVTDYTYGVVDENGEALTDGGEFSVDCDFEASEYTFNYRNPGDAVVTYNEDGTMNVYLYVEFSTSDPDLYCELVLDKEYRLRDRVFAIENVRFGRYGLEYKICKEIGGVRYVVERVYPSGTVEPNSYVESYAIFEGNNVTVSISQYVQCDFDSMRFVSPRGEEIAFDNSMLRTDLETGDYLIDLSFSEEAEYLTVYLNVKTDSFSNDYAAILDAIELKGTEYCPIIVQLVK